MNVLKRAMNVLRCVPTLLEVTHVPAAQAIAWLATVVDAMVNTSNQTIKNFNANFDLIIHSDINECNENIDACDHLCSNTVGSYTCSCRSGYRLASNGLTCNGITVT